MAKETYFDQELVRQTCEAQIEALSHDFDDIDFSIIDAEQDSDDHSDKWSEEYSKICDAVAGPDAPHIPDEILTFFEQNDERVNAICRNIITEWYGDSDIGKRIQLAFDTIDKEGI